MPTITSSQTGPPANRSRQRLRRRVRKTTANQPKHRPRSIKRQINKRQRREQSTDVEDCFEDCKELGYHLDPDVHIGSHTDNPFSMLTLESPSNESHYSVPSTGFTFTSPSPCVAEAEPSIERQCLNVFRSERGMRSQNQRAYPIGSDKSEATRSYISIAEDATHLLFATSCSIPNTPPAQPTIHIPERASSPAPNDTEASNTAAPMNNHSFLNGFRIPSPLLYHRKSREEIGIEEDYLCLEPSFQTAVQDHLNNEKVEISKRSFAFGPHIVSGDIGLPTFIGAALPKMGQDVGQIVEAPDIVLGASFYTNTRSYLAPRNINSQSPSETNASTPAVQRSTLTRTPITHVYPAKIAVEQAKAQTDCDYDQTLPRSSLWCPPLERSCQTGCINTNNDLVFPTLPAPTKRKDKSLDRYFERTLDLWARQEEQKRGGGLVQSSLNNDTVNYTDDNDSSHDLWSVFEKSVLEPEQSKTDMLFILPEPKDAAVKLDCFPVVRLPTARKESTFWTPSAPIGIKIPMEISVSVCPTSTCTSLVPVNFYERQYLGWSRKGQEEARVPKTRYSGISKIVKEIQESRNSGKIQETVDWIAKDLGFDVQHDESCKHAVKEVMGRSWLFGEDEGWDGNIFDDDPTGKYYARLGAIDRSTGEGLGYPGPRVVEEEALEIPLQADDFDLGEALASDDSDSDSDSGYWSLTHVDEEDLTEDWESWGEEDWSENELTLL